MLRMIITLIRFARRERGRFVCGGGVGSVPGLGRFRFGRPVRRPEGDIDGVRISVYIHASQV